MIKWVAIWSLILCQATLMASPLRIVSLSPVITEILFELNLSDHIVGVTTYCDFPTKAVSITKIGDYKPNLEKVLTVKPNIILGLGLNKEIQQSFRKVSLHATFFESPTTFKAMYKMIQDIGEETMASNEATLLVTHLKKEITSLSENKKIETSPTIATIVWAPPLMLANTNTFIADIIRATGAKPVGIKSRLPFPNIQDEALLSINPDYIVITHPDVKTYIQNKAAFAQLKAVKNNRIIDSVNRDLLVRAGPRVPTAIRLLKKAFYEKTL